MTGEWSIVIDPSSQIPGSKEGTITSGHIGKNSYVLKGEETVNSISDCGVFNPPPTTVTISGKCGEDVKIYFRSANKVETATFPGVAFPGVTDVACS